MKNLLTPKAKAIAYNIRKVREFKHLTQEYLAIKIGISQNAYSKIELGYSQINLGRLFEIAAILEVEAEHLITMDERELIDILSKV